MELVRKNIHMEHQINWASTQISLEEDQNISDQKPDAYKIVCKKADAKVEEIKPVEEAVFVRGTLEYCVLYLTDEKEKSLCNMEGKIPFEEKIYTEKNVSGEGLRVSANVEDLSIRLINSRKLNIRTIIGVCVKQDELYDEEMVIDVENPKMCEILKKPLDVTTIVLDTKDIYRIKEEVQLPDGFPNIYHLLWKDIALYGLSFTPMEGRIAISGEMKGFFLYEGEEENGSPRCFDISRPFSGTVDVPECREGMILCMDYDIEKVMIEVKPDYDGEEREIDVDVELKLYIKLYNHCMLSFVADAYGIQEKMLPVMKEASLMKIQKRDSGKIKVSGSWENTETEDGLMQILCVNGKLIESHAQMNAGEVLLEGVLHTEALLATDNNAETYKCVSLDIPYEHILPMGVPTEVCLCQAKVGIDQINAVISGERMEIRVILSYQVEICDNKKEELLIDMKKEENGQETEAFPVMSVYFARENEDIWSVGKRYQVSLDSIRNINELSKDELQEGQKLLIALESI